MPKLFPFKEGNKDDLKISTDMLATCYIESVLSESFLNRYTLMSKNLGYLMTTICLDFGKKGTQ